MRESAELPFFAVLSQGEAVGFAALKPHNAYTAEVCVMGVLAAHHRRGIGRMLIHACERWCVARGMVFLTVKTLDEAHPDPGYARTRCFYLGMGFRPLEVFKELWGEDNPCLMLAKALPAAEADAPPA